MHHRSPSTLPSGTVRKSMPNGYNNGYNNGYGGSFASGSSSTYSNGSRPPPPAVILLFQPCQEPPWPGPRPGSVSLLRPLMAAVPGPPWPGMFPPSNYPIHRQVYNPRSFTRKCLSATRHTPPARPGAPLGPGEAPRATRFVLPLVIWQSARHDQSAVRGNPMIRGRGRILRLLWGSL